MKNGRIAQAGRFDELLQQNIGFEVLVGAHSQALESILSAKNSSRKFSLDGREVAKISSSDDCDEENETNTRCQGISKKESGQDLSQDITERGRIVQDEEREKGGIGKQVYLTYLRAIRGGALVPVIIIAQSFFQVLQVASNYWMAWASPPTTATDPTVGVDLLFLIYILLSVGSSFCILIRAMLLAVVGLLTSEKFFRNMLRCIMHAPMSFFDSTPAGRILNRVSII